jgi:hypothetical protein
MEKLIERVTNLYAQGLITKDEMASLIAKEYAKLWARGKLIASISK